MQTDYEPIPIKLCKQFNYEIPKGLTKVQSDTWRILNTIRNIILNQNPPLLLNAQSAFVDQKTKLYRSNQNTFQEKTLNAIVEWNLIVEEEKEHYEELSKQSIAYWERIRREVENCKIDWREYKVSEAKLQLKKKYLTRKEAEEYWKPEQMKDLFKKYINKKFEMQDLKIMLKLVNDQYNSITKSAYFLDRYRLVDECFDLNYERNLKKGQSILNAFFKLNRMHYLEIYTTPFSLFFFDKEREKNCLVPFKEVNEEWKGLSKEQRNLYHRLWSLMCQSQNQILSEVIMID